MQSLTCHGERKKKKKPAVLLGFGKCPLLINGDAADANLKAGLNRWLAEGGKAGMLMISAVDGMSPGAANHELIYAKLENKLCVPRSISHPLSTSNGLQLTCTPKTV